MEEVGRSRALDDLPEGCIAHVIGLTCLRDACRSAAVSPTFLSAAESDTVWDRFLPSDIGSILDRAVNPIQYSSKKELYFRLCSDAGVLLDGGRMNFSLERSSGAKCYMLSARELNIAWGDNPEHWTWLSGETYRFSEVAHLINVRWLEIRGKIDTQTLSPETNYAAYLVFKLEEDVSSFASPDYRYQRVSIKVGSDESTDNVVRLVPIKPWTRRISQGTALRRMRFIIPFSKARVPGLRADGWMEIELGEFFNGGGENREVEMRFMELEEEYRKSGLTVQGIAVRPKMFSEFCYPSQRINFESEQFRARWNLSFPS